MSINIAADDERYCFAHRLSVSLSVGRITTATVLRLFVWDYPGEPVPEEKLTHPPS